MSDELSGEMLAIQSGATTDRTPEQLLKVAAKRAHDFYVALAKLSPFLESLDFKSADEEAAKILDQTGTPFLMTKEYQNVRHDFENMEKINKLLEDHNFRTAKIEYDLREIGLGGYAYEEFYERAKGEAVKTAAPILKEAIRSRDFDKAKIIAAEFLKTSDDINDSNVSTYDRLVEILKPEYHFLVDDAECYYAPLEIKLDSLDFDEYAEDAFYSLEQIAKSENTIDKVLAMIWIVEYGLYDFLADFADDDFLDTAWFAEILRGTIKNIDLDARGIITELLAAGIPNLARKVFNVHRSLTEDDYYEIVKGLAEKIAEEKDNKNTDSDSVEDTVTENTDDNDPDEIEDPDDVYGEEYEDESI